MFERLKSLPMFAWLKKPDIVTTLQTQSGAVLADARQAASDALQHTEALLELFRLELREYGQCQARRMVAILVGVGLLLVSYLLLCAALCVLLGQYVFWPLAVAIVFLANFAGGLILLICGVKLNPGPLAPATRQELKNDLQCIKLALAEKKKS